MFGAQAVQTVFKSEHSLNTAGELVLADPNHEEYDISLVRMVPALVQRARTALPEAFRSGRGVAYDDEDISRAIDDAHAKHIRLVLLPVVLGKLGSIVGRLERGGAIADLGCGGGNLVIALARRFPQSKVVGFEVSDTSDPVWKSTPSSGTSEI